MEGLSKFNALAKFKLVLIDSCSPIFEYFSGGSFICTTLSRKANFCPCLCSQKWKTVCSKARKYLFLRLTELI